MGKPNILDPSGLTGLGSGGGGHRNSLTAPMNGTNVLPDTSHTFDPYNMYIPQVYNSNQPVTDPTAIIQGYEQHAPEFLAASQGNPKIPPASELKSQQQGK